MKALALSILVGLLLITSSASASFFDYNFDSDAVGSTPVGWWTSDATKSYVSDTFSVSPSHSYRQRGSTIAHTEANPGDATGTFSYEVYLTDPTYAKIYPLMSDTTGTYRVNLALGSAYMIDYSTGAYQYSGILSLNTWHSIDVKFDAVAGTFDLVVDGVDKGVRPMAAGGNLAGYVFGANEYGTAFYDNVRLVPEPLTLSLLGLGLGFLASRRSRRSA
jgi:hypothetical protein